MKSNYQNLIELYNKMTSDIPHERPNCEQILRDKNSWALTAKGIF